MLPLILVVFISSLFTLYCSISRLSVPAEISRHHVHDSCRGRFCGVRLAACSMPSRAGWMKPLIATEANDPSKDLGETPARRFFRVSQVRLERADRMEIF